MSSFNFGASLQVAGVPESAAFQIETATVVGTIIDPGDAEVILTSAIVTGSPLAFAVAVETDDDDAAVAAKIVAALQAESLVTDHYSVEASGADIILTALEAEANDATLNLSIDNDTCTGLTTAATSADTQAGAHGHYRGAGNGQIAVDNVSFAFYINSGSDTFPTWEVMDDLTTVNLGAALTVSSAPSNGDFTGAGSGQLVIDTTNYVIYQNTGTPAATVWEAM